MAFARAVGEYGSVIFIAGNLPMKTEITPLLIVIKLEQFDYAGAAALGFIMLVHVLRDAAVDQPAAGLGAATSRRRGALMAGPGLRKELLAEIATPSGPRHGPELRGRRRRSSRLSLLFLAALLFAPLITVFATALEKGFELYFGSFQDSDTLAAIRLTLTVAAIVVPVNTVFGIAAAWAIAKFEFKGKSFLITLIDLPIAVSPVISGLVYVLLFGMQGWFGLWLQEHDISIIFALPGIVLATMFVTFPYVARELIPLMQQLGNDEEEAAITLGAGGLMTFFHVTLPKIRWGLRVRRHPLQRARDGRVRRGVGRLAATSAA